MVRSKLLLTRSTHAGQTKVSLYLEETGENVGLANEQEGSDVEDRDHNSEKELILKSTY